MSTKKPYEIKPIVYSVYGRRFNAPNDLCVHPKSGALFFTDPNYAEKQNFAGPQSVCSVSWSSAPSESPFIGSLWRI